MRQYATPTNTIAHMLARMRTRARTSTCTRAHTQTRGHAQTPIHMHANTHTQQNTQKKAIADSSDLIFHMSVTSSPSTARLDKQIH